MNAYIYNVSPDSVFDIVGEFGAFTIPGKKADEPYARMLIKDIKYNVDKGDDKFPLETQSGEGIVDDILSRNSTLGLFKAAKDEPSPEEVKAAQEKLFENDTQRIAFADRMWQKKRDRGLINDEARKAAMRRNVTKEWMDTISGDVHKRCPFCDEDVRAAANVCKHCGNKIDAGSLPVAIPIETEPKPARATRG